MVSARGLTKVYRMGRLEVRALDGVDLAIEKGEFTAIIGRSGSGKSTLLNILGALDRPTSGQVALDGVELSRLSDSQRARVRREKIGFVFQQFNLIPVLTALENVMLPLKYAGVSLEERRRRSVAVLETLGLSGRLDHRPVELSGGEMQRVAVARAMVNSPSIVLADEPTGELDSHTAHEIIDMMLELNRNKGQTFVIVSHDPAVAARARRVIRMEDGHIQEDTGRASRQGTGIGER